MITTLDVSRQELEKLYERIASDYCSSLPLEHFMESTDQSTQRKITVESLDLVTAQWPEFQVFSELLILYPLTDADLKKPTRVCPDNMVIVHDEPIVAKGSFNVPLQPVGPTLILDYISTENKRKDYVDNRRRYATDLHVPYYLLFEPEVQKLTVFRLSGEKYVAVKPNAAGRLAIPPLKLEAAIHEDWVRFWFGGELLPLPADLLKENESLKKEIARLKAVRNGHS
jgi:Uma2 family endonuclease